MLKTPQYSQLNPQNRSSFAIFLLKKVKRGIMRYPQRAPRVPHPQTFLSKLSSLNFNGWQIEKEGERERAVDEEKNNKIEHMYNKRDKKNYFKKTNKVFFLLLLKKLSDIFVFKIFFARGKAGWGRGLNLSSNQNT